MKNNMKKYLSVIAAFTIIISMCLMFTVSAAAEDRSLPRVIDETGTLTQDEINTLKSQAEAFINAYNMDCVLVLVNSLDGKSPRSFADDYFDYNGYGTGINRDGILLMVCTSTRDLYISTRGSSIHAFTDREIDKIGDDIAYYLADDDYYSGFCEFILSAERKVLSGDDGAADTYILGLTASSWLIVFCAALLIAGISVLIMRGTMNNARGKSEAADYAVGNSFRVTRSFDMFLYRSVSRTRRQTESNGGGGSSTHRSSSGATHGGGGRKF